MERNYFTESINNLAIQNHHLIKKYQIFYLNKLNSATLYEILIDANKIKPTSQTYFENLLQNFKHDWLSIYLLLLNNMLLGLRKLIPLSAHIIMKKKKLRSSYFISTLKPNSYGTSSDNTFHNS